MVTLRPVKWAESVGLEMLDASWGHHLGVPWISRADGILTAVVWVTPRYERGEKEIITMNILLAIVAIIAVILLFTGGLRAVAELPAVGRHRAC